jgi:hypothetical protein
MTYRSELVQVAAVCLAAAQCEEVDSTSLSADAEGIRGRSSALTLQNEVYGERQRQELKWGTRTRENAHPVEWLTILLEEIGEVAEEIVKASPDQFIVPDIVQEAIELGAKARVILEARNAV